MKFRAYDLTGEGAFHVSRSLNKGAFVKPRRVAWWKRLARGLKAALLGRRAR